MDNVRLFIERAQEVLPLLAYLTAGQKVIVAGGSFLEGNFGDIDIWGIEKHPPWTERFRLVNSTKWASTYSYKNRLVQLCYPPEGLELTLESLLDSFDLGICQIGAEVSFSEDGIYVHRSLATKKYEEARSSGRLVICKVTNPLISFYRGVKYLTRLDNLNYALVKEDMLKLVYTLLARGVGDPLVLNVEPGSAEEPWTDLANQLFKLFSELHKASIYINLE